MTRQKKQAIYGAVYILPSFLLMLFFTFIPIFMTIYFSFTKYNLGQPPQWIGLENYSKLISNSYLHQALINTVQYVAVTVPIQTLLSLVIAAFLSSRLRNHLGSALRSMMFIPVVASMIASAAVWNVIYETNGGIINQVLEFFGIPGYNWLGRKSSALNCVAVVAIWKNVGYFLVIFYAGIMNISVDITEAACVDGATPIQRFFYITLPILKPITYMVVTLGIIWSFQVFDLVYKMTAGGPGRATYTVAYLIYSYAFQDKRIGYGAALAVCLLIVILLIHGIQNLLFKDREAA
ncbi:MAG: sugar ABC transporter permease [Clostridia bacterium]|nr:sugar ABC transporter permease [Clostridia bacterium]